MGTGYREPLAFHEPAHGPVLILRGTETGGKFGRGEEPMEIGAARIVKLAEQFS
jgi:hypothetical protein